MVHKVKQFYLISNQIKNNAIKAIQDCAIDGKTKVSIGNASNKSARQRGLQWAWYKDVAESGIGGRHEDTDIGVSVKSKFMFGLPIAKKNPEKYADFLILFSMVMENQAEDFIFRFFRDNFHTEWFDSTEMAEFLTNFQNYYTARGASLSDPIDYKLLRAA